MATPSPFALLDTDVDRPAPSRAMVSEAGSSADGQRCELEPLEPRLLLSGTFTAEFIQVDNSAELSGYNTYDLQVTSDVYWASASLRLELDQGSIYQNPVGSDRAPNPLLIDAFPGLEFDTYVSMGGKTTTLQGRAEHIGGDAFQFDSTEIDASWGNAEYDKPDTLIIGRFTLSEDAAGSIGFWMGDYHADNFTNWNSFEVGDLTDLTNVPAPESPPPTPIPDPPPVDPTEFGVRFVQVDNSELLTGYKTFDLEVTTDQDWTVAAMLIELTGGSIYQDPFGTNFEPTAGVVALFPTLEFDSYVAANGHVASIAGGAGDVGGNGLRFDTVEIDVSWSDLAQDDLGTIVIGRFTVSDDAEGIVRLKVAQAGNNVGLVSSETFTEGILITGDSTAPLPPKPEPITAKFVEVDNGDVTPGFKTYDLRVTSESDWMNASLQLDLTGGSIYQDAAGTILAPNPGAFSEFPALEYDTYVTSSSRLTSIVGDADGDSGFNFDAQNIDISWTAPGKDDTGTFSIGRITLSDDAVGELRLVVDGRRSDTFVNEVAFTAGALGVPVPSASRAADFTGDGMPDILWWNSETGRNQVWQMNGTSFMNSIDLPAIADSNWRAVGTADLTGDGKTDILWRHSRNGRNRVTEMDGTDVQSNIDIKRLRSRAWVVGGLGDFTGDGKTDILWRNTRNGRNSVWEMDGTIFQKGVALKSVKNADWSIAGVADLTSDGKADIIWRNTRNGRNTAWEMDGTQFQRRAEIRRNKNQVMQIVGVGDYTGDGRTDLLWRNTKNGGNVVWELNGTSYRNKFAVKAQTNDEWRPAGTLLGLWE